MPARSKRQLRAAYAGLQGKGPIPRDVARRMLAHTPEATQRRLMRARAGRVRAPR